MIPDQRHNFGESSVHQFLGSYIQGFESSAMYPVHTHSAR